MGPGLSGLFNTAGTAGTAAAGAAAGGLPWTILLPIALSFFTSLFGENEEDKKREDALKMQQLLQQMGLNQPYQSPYLPGMDKVSVQAILNQLGRSGNWGWPEGKGMDMSFIQDMLGNIPNLSAPSSALPTQKPSVRYDPGFNRGRV